MQLSPVLKARLLQPPLIIGGAVAGAAIAIVLTLVYTAPAVAGGYVHPVQGAIMQEVDAPGAVKAADQVDLSFERSGRIVRVSAPVGGHVSAGATLASIDSADLLASLEQAKAALAMQQAKLDALQAGARPESIAVAQAAVDAAQATYAQQVQTVAATIQSAYAASDDAIHNKVDQLLNGPRTASPTLRLTLSDAQLQASIVSQRVDIEVLLSDWNTAQQQLTASSSGDEVIAAASLATTDLRKISDYLDLVATGLTKAIPTAAYSATTISSLQTSVTLGRTNVATANASLNSALTALTSARGALASAQSSLALAKAPATSQDIAQQQAQVAAAQANVDAALAQLSKATLRAPFSGTITVDNAHLGAIASPGMPIISMISDAQFQFETYVSEVDLAKVKVGNGAQVTLDAYANGAPIDAHVVAVDPAATEQNGVAVYKVTLQFDTADPRIKAGLSGNVHITTETKQSTLTLPSSAIITKADGTYVLRKGTSGDELVPVTVGIVSGTGTTEILSGITANDLVRTFTTQ